MNNIYALAYFFAVFFISHACAAVDVGETTEIRSYKQGILTAQLKTPYSSVKCSVFLQAGDIEDYSTFVFFSV